jgi:hypothetical protein
MCINLYVYLRDLWPHYVCTSILSTLMISVRTTCFNNQLILPFIYRFSVILIVNSNYFLQTTNDRHLWWLWAVFFQVQTEYSNISTIFIFKGIMYNWAVATCTEVPWREEGKGTLKARHGCQYQPALSVVNVKRSTLRLYVPVLVEVSKLRYGRYQYYTASFYSFFKCNLPIKY